MMRLRAGQPPVGGVGEAAQVRLGCLGRAGEAGVPAGGLGLLLGPGAQLEREAGLAAAGAAGEAADGDWGGAREPDLEGGEVGVAADERDGAEERIEDIEVVL